jgi:hypothetical protein
MAIDIDQAGAVIATFNNVVIPDFLVERAGVCRGHVLPVKPPCPRFQVQPWISCLAFPGRFALAHGQAANRTV